MMTKINMIAQVSIILFSLINDVYVQELGVDVIVDKNVMIPAPDGTFLDPMSLRKTIVSGWMLPVVIFPDGILIQTRANRWAIIDE